MSKQKETRKKRKFQICKTYEVKVDKSALSKEKLKFLSRLFLEAKWWYNYIISQDKVFKIDCKVKKILVMNKDKQFEEREIHLTYGLKQDIYENFLSSIKSLSTKKKKGKVVGKLKFKNCVKTVFGKIYVYGKDLIKIEGFKRYFRVDGLDQIPKCSEIANIKLIRKHGDYYFHITTFQPKQEQCETNQMVGIDLGVKDTLNFSNGIKVNVNIPISKRIKKLQQRLARQEKNSKNSFKTRIKLEKAYDERNNKKKDATNKIVSYLNTNFDRICVQNDNIAGWQRLYGRKVNSSIIGRTLAKLKTLPKTIVVGRYFPSTKLCPSCGIKNLLLLSDRVYKCGGCSYEEDRDTKSAKLILNEGMKQVPTECRDFKLVENKTSGLMFEYFKTIPNINLSLCSVKQENNLSC